MFMLSIRYAFLGDTYDLDPLEKGMATHSRILAWIIPWTEEPGGLESLGSQRTEHNSATNNSGDGDRESRLTDIVGEGESGRIERVEWKHAFPE